MLIALVAAILAGVPLVAPQPVGDLLHAVAAAVGVVPPAE